MNIAKEKLYFTADLQSLILTLPSEESSPASLWLRLPGEAVDKAAWVLTAATYARIIWQCDQLEKRHLAEEYPRAKLEQIATRLAPIQAFAEKHLDFKLCDQCWEYLEKNGGPRSKLEPPDPLPPSPFDPPSPLNLRWNSERRRFEKITV